MTRHSLPIFMRELRRILMSARCAVCEADAEFSVILVKLSTRKEFFAFYCKEHMRVAERLQSMEIVEAEKIAQ